MSTTPAPTPTVLDVKQVAALLRCEPKTVREHGLRLGGLKFGRDWIFPGGALARRLDEMALANTASGAPPPVPAAVIPATRPATTGTRRTRRAPPPLPG